MSDISTLSTRETVIVACPVLMLNNENDVENCGVPLDVTVYVSVVGDDYGSWEQFTVDFPCGHTLDDMGKSLLQAEYT